jgi:hypothetical protein
MVYCGAVGKVSIKAVFEKDATFRLRRTLYQAKLRPGSRAKEMRYAV